MLVNCEDGESPPFSMKYMSEAEMVRRIVAMKAVTTSSSALALRTLPMRAKPRKDRSIRSSENMRSSRTSEAARTFVPAGVARSMMNGMIASRSMSGSGLSIQLSRLGTRLDEASGASKHAHSRKVYSTENTTSPT